LVAVNGSKRMHAGYAGKEIVDEWNKYICDKNSYAFNVNYLKGGYRSGLRLLITGMRSCRKYWIGTLAI
jgi:hypothetical protein